MNINKIVILVLCLISAILIIVSFALLIPKYNKLKETEKIVQKLEQELAEKKTEISLLKEQLSGLSNDPEILEKFAREKYGYCRDGEIIYIYDKEELSGLLNSGKISVNF